MSDTACQVISIQNCCDCQDKTLFLGNTMALFFYQKSTRNCNQTHGCRNDENELVAARSVIKHSTHVGPKSAGQVMHSGHKAGQQAHMRQSIEPAHQGCGEWGRYHKSEAEQECEDIEIELIRVFQYQYVDHKPQHKRQGDRPSISKPIRCRARYQDTPHTQQTKKGEYVAGCLEGDAEIRQKSHQMNGHQKITAAADEHNDEKQPE